MAIRGIGPGTVGAIASATGTDIKRTDSLPVKLAVDIVVAPIAGEVVRLLYGPIVEGNLFIAPAGGGSYYTPGEDFLELMDGAFQNLAIPEGQTLAVEYFYYVGVPTGATSGVGLPGPVIPSGGSGGESGVMRYATLAKLGL